MKIEEAIRKLEERKDYIFKQYTEYKKTSFGKDWRIKLDEITVCISICKGEREPSGKIVLGFDEK